MCGLNGYFLGSQVVLVGTNASTAILSKQHIKLQVHVMQITVSNYLRGCARLYGRHTCLILRQANVQFNKEKENSQC